MHPSMFVNPAAEENVPLGHRCGADVFAGQKYDGGQISPHASFSTLVDAMFNGLYSTASNVTTDVAVKASLKVTALSKAGVVIVSPRNTETAMSASTHDETTWMLLINPALYAMVVTTVLSSVNTVETSAVTPKSVNDTVERSARGRAYSAPEVQMYPSAQSPVT
jgi:hypothetical protein